MHEKHIPAAVPDICGPAGRAWRFDCDAIHAGQLAMHGKAPPRELSIASWAVYAPNSHPIWPCVAVLGISLRDVPGWPAAKINMPGATHEVFVLALDPNEPIRLDEGPIPLRPSNFAGQFIAASDEQAAAMIESAVQEICAGTLNPDSDGRRQWVERFSGSNLLPGALDPHFIAGKPGTLIMVGTGAQNVRALEEIVNTVATLSADESKPQ